MPFLFTSPSPLTEAFRLALERGVLPLALNTESIREQLTQAIRQSAVFSARTTNAVYLQAVKEAVERALKGGYDNDRGRLRMELKELLRRLGYTPETGFPGDEAHEIPPAKSGSLRDLSSDRRINLILDTQERLMRGASLKTRGAERADTFPAWQLVRVFPRRVPRGEAGSGTKGWEQRWVDAGGKPSHTKDGRTVLVALKSDPIWRKLGDSALFADALDVDHPPFAFNSGMGWDELDRDQTRAILGEVNTEAPARGGDEGQAGAVPEIPEPQFSAAKMSPEFKAALVEKLKGVRGKISLEELRRIKRGMANALLSALKEAA